MKTKPQWTQATCRLLQALDKLYPKPYKWLIGRCGINLFFISLSLSEVRVRESKMEFRAQRQTLHILMEVIVYCNFSNKDFFEPIY